MNNSITSIFEAVRKLKGKGLFDIFGANVINKILAFLSSISIVRILTKEEFGTYAYLQNILSFFLLLNGAGVTSGYLQYGSKYWKDFKRFSFFKYSFKIGLTCNFIIGILISAYALFLSCDSKEISMLLIYMCLIPFFSLIFELLQTYNRVERDFKKYSRLTTINTVVYVLGMLAGAYLMKVTGIIVFHYIALFISILFGVYTFSARNVQWSKIKEPERKEKKNFMSFSILTMLSNAAGQLTYILDVFIIGFLLKDLNILASYKTATIIPFALTFIPISIMIFVYPYFVEHARDVDWVKKNYKNLLLYNGAFNLAISLFLIIFSKLIIRICFGEQYIDTLYAFIILSAGYFISASFRIPAGNILAALGKVKINLYITIIAGILQIILDVVLILNIGSIGAAISSLCIFVFTGMLNNILLYRTINGQVSHNNQASI